MKSYLAGVDFLGADGTLKDAANLKATFSMSKASQVEININFDYKPGIIKSTVFLQL